MIYLKINLYRFYNYFLLLFVLSFGQLYGQSKDNDKAIRELFSSIVFISDSIPKIIDSSNGKKYQLIYKDLGTGRMLDKPILSSGSGFIISKDLDMYLVTAKHVAKNISIDGKIQFNDYQNKSKELKIKNLIKNGGKFSQLDWVFHPTADVAVLHMSGFLRNEQWHSKIGLTSVSYSALSDSLVAPNRLEEITLFGFPLNLGAQPHTPNPRSVSPISKNLRPASDILWLNVKGVINPYFLLDDPSISGFSGGPVMGVNHHFSADINGKEIGVEPTLFGLVQGTINDETGGFATIVPSKNILETIDLAPSYNGKYTFYYPNGNIWSERIYVNGFPWTVLSNYDPQGNPQDKGTLINGNGYFYVYNKNGELEWGFTYKNGRPQGNFRVMSKKQEDKIRKAKNSVSG